MRHEFGANLDSPTPPTDLELLTGWKAGDPKAGHVLLQRHFPALHAFFAAKVAPGEASDLVQQTMLAALEGLDRFRAEGSFRAYLFGIARNLLYAHYRHNKRRRERGFDPAVTSLVDLAPSPTQRCRDREEKRLLLEALNHLPLDLQITVELHQFQSLTTAEIAVVLGIPQGTVKSQYRRAKERLRAKIEELGRSGPLITSTTVDLDRWAREIRRENGLEEPLLDALA